MKRSTLPSILVYLLMIVGLATLQPPLVLLAIPFMLYLATGLLYGPPQKIALRATRELSADRVSTGQPVEIKLTITNDGEYLEQLLLEDLVPAGLAVSKGHARLLTTLRPGETVELTYTLQGPRGYYQFPGIRATASDMLEIFTRQADLRLFNHLFILPELSQTPQVALRPRRTRVFPGLSRARKGGPGVEFFGLREYQPGDSLRWVNSRTSARHEQRIFVNEFEQERAVDVGLIVDARQKTNLNINGQSLFEYTIQATSTLADVFITQGNRVSMFIYGGYFDWTFPGYGKLQRERIFRALARAELQDSIIFQKLENLPTRLFPARSQLVFISPLRIEDLDDLIGLRAHDYQLLVVSPNPVEYEIKTLPPSRSADLALRIARLERRFLFRQLQQMGVRMVDWNIEEPFYQAAHPVLRYPPQVWNRMPGGR